MKTILLTPLFCLALACSGGQAKVDDPAKASGGAADKAKLAPCTAGADVPADSTNCLLDLGGGGDSHWADTDGVDPGTAGCHYEFTDSTCGAFKDGRTFGELCLDADRLVESNPGAGECHTHGRDFGKPDVVSCAAWCKQTSSTGGRCESGVEASGEHGSCQSARCVCDEA